MTLLPKLTIKPNCHLCILISSHLYIENPARTGQNSVPTSPKLLNNSVSALEGKRNHGCIAACDPNVNSIVHFVIQVQCMHSHTHTHVLYCVSA